MLLITLYIIIAIGATFIFIMHLKNIGISISTTFHVVYLVYYFIIPPVMLWMLDYTDMLSLHIIRFDFIANTTIEQRYLSFLLAAIGYVFFLLIFHAKIFPKKTETLSIGEDFYETKGLYNTLSNAGWVFAMIGIISFCVVIFELGGVSSMLAIAGSLRGYNVDISGNFSAIGAMCLQMTGFLFGAAICLISCRKKKKNISLWLAVVLFFLVLYLLYNQGRSPIVFFSVCVLYAYLKKKGIKESRIIAVFFVLAVAVILGSGSLRATLRSVSSGQVVELSLIDNIESTLSDLSYPYANTLNAMYFTEKYGFRFFKDYLLWIPEILPSRLLSLIGIQLPEAQTMTEIVSYEYSKGFTYLGGVPVDFLTSGYFQGGVLGAIVNSMIVLCLLRKMERIIDSLPKECSSIKFWMCCTITLAVVINLDPCKLPLSYLYLFILIFILRKQAIRMRLYRRIFRLM